MDTCTQPQTSHAHNYSKGLLDHTNLHLFQLFSVIEVRLKKFVNSVDVFSNIVDYVMENYSDLLTFLCLEHRSEISTMIFQNHIVMQMIQYTEIHNRELCNNNLKEKKFSKLLLTIKQGGGNFNLHNNSSRHY